MNHNYYDNEYSPTNRDKRLTPKRVFGWCDGCDRVLVSGGKKCPVCGHRQGKYRLKR